MYRKRPLDLDCMMTYNLLNIAIPAAAGTIVIPYGTGSGGGGNTTFTTSTTHHSTFTTVFLPDLQVNTFLTRIIANLNGGPNVFDQSFNVAFADPTVQAAIAQAHTILTLAGALSINGPTLVFN